MALLGSASIAASNPAAAAGTYFGTLPPRSALPSDGACRGKVLATTDSWEPRPANRTANHRTGGALRVRIHGASDAYNAKYASRIRSDFTGTTNQILRWGACKWGLDEDITKARAVVESYWRQGQRGDLTHSARGCRLIGRAAPCWRSYGILQVKGTVHKGTYPTAQRSTAFNVDYALAWQRACYDGDFAWLGRGYRAGDIWGCVGAWFSGKWHDRAAGAYIARVKTVLAKRVWERPGF